jgi:hypothetical protein
VKVDAGQPAVASVGEIHGEINMSAQGLKAGLVETLDGAHVAGYWSDRQVLIAPGDSLSDYAVDEESPHASAPVTISDYDRLHFTAAPAIK